MDKPLRDLLNVNFFTWTSWCDDPDATDVYPDGAGDIVRVPNQILNVYLSQLVENGVLRGYGMNFYDATAKDGWTPLGYNPAPWGFYGLPGKPADVLQHVEVPALTSHMTEMEMVTHMVETATATNAIEKGQAPEGVQTLGEINLMVAKADERLKDIPKFARLHAKELGRKLCELIEANTDKLNRVTLYKKSPAGTYYEKTIDPKALRTRKGYNCVVTLKTEKEADSLKAIQKLKIAAEQFPGNLPLAKILKNRMLSWIELNPDEKAQVMEFEDQLPATMPGAPVAAPRPSPLNAPAIA